MRADWRSRRRSRDRQPEPRKYGSIWSSPRSGWHGVYVLTVTIGFVDRRHVPGGHWNDAYPFVRLHGPSALYGVNSRRLGSDVIEQAGPNAGFYPRDSG